MKKSHSLLQRILALTLVLLLAASPLPLRAAAEAPEAESPYVLESRNLEPFAAGAKADGEAQRINDTFTILWSNKSKVDSSSKTWEDGYASDQRINFGGKATTEKNAVQITTTGPATVKIWWVQGGDDNREMAILNAEGETAAVTSGAYEKNSPYYSELELTEGGVWYLGGAANNNYLFKVEVVPAPETYVLEALALEPFSGGKEDGDTTAVGDFFTILWSSKSKVDSSSKTWEDGYTSNQRINFGGKADVTKNAIRFETAGEATVKIWWVQGGDDNREMAILNANGETAAVTSGAYEKNSPYLSELRLTEGGLWYLGGATGNNYIFKVEVTTGAAERPPRADWDQVPLPAITNAAQEGGNILVTVSALVGYDGADAVTVTMRDSEGQPVEEKSSGREQEEHELTFTPAASDTYTFSVCAARAEEETLHEGLEPCTVAFVLPLAKPAFISAANLGGGAVALEWEPSAEAEGYELTVDGTELQINTAACTATVEGLTVGETYTFRVAALRGEERSEADAITCTVAEEAEIAWAFSAFGTGVTLSNEANGYSGSANEGSVRVWSTGGKGKLVPASTDGLAFYYTKIDPKTTNFKLTATANVLSWTYSNGQEGFGLMAADAVGRNGDNTTFWNNSYMATVTKVEYTSEAGDKISMKLGVGAQEKAGVTPENINEAHQLDDMSRFSSTMGTLDDTCAALGAGTYNLVGNYTNNPGPEGTVENPLTSFRLTVEKNNTGYFVSYTDPAGLTTTRKAYDVEALSHLDPDYVYVGFFASRNATVEFTDIELTTSDPAADPPAEEQPVTEVDPSFRVESASIANGAAHTLVYYGNADGQLTVRSEAAELFNGPVTANTKVRIPVTLNRGENSFTLVMTPDPNYKPSEFQVLSSYEPVTFTHRVRFEVNEAPVVYAAPAGDPASDGLTRQAPTSITAAVQRAIPGQTIYLMEGTYTLTSALILERGMDGTQDQPIRLWADPLAASRPVLSFSQASAGVILASNWWHLRGFDVTATADGQKGVQVSGSHNTLELLETYRNGNTGIQLSRYKGTDERDEWPADNLILNCTSMLNADRGYEDADGFAAKLTIGEGNVFDGCIAAYNADDGWDLYAKVENGPIGRVEIRNSVAYKNGYILDETGAQVNAGNGNGFKMGGESMPGGHTLINSLAFANKAKGIDSNSCPDIKVYRSTSFDNESYNVAFYTNTAVNTDFAAEGVLSFKVSNTVGENLKPVGSQDQSRIYGPTNFYYANGLFQNSEGLAVAEDWFVSLDTEAAIHGGVTRNPDGSINLNGYLEPTDKVPEGVGARFPAYESPFADVTEDQWFYDAVIWAYNHAPQITAGTDEAHFSPDAACTRAQVMTFLWHAQGNPAAAGTENPFMDVLPGRYYEQPVLWAYENGITSGVSPTAFGVSLACRREQVVTFLWKAAGAPEPEAGENPFTDVREDSYYCKAVLWAAQQGFTSGIGRGLFGVGQTCTRAEIVTFLYAAYGNN